MICVGTSGWQYSDFKATFYPEDLPSAARLAYYAERLRTVEINSTFYHMPCVATVQKWADETPEIFHITVKLNRYFTHTKKLAVDDEFCAKLDEFLTAVMTLGDKIAVVLVQLPPSLRCDLATLQAFLDAIDGRVTIALECRHESWINAEVREMLETYQALWVINDSPDKWPTAPWVIGGMVYLRMHGRERLYASSYSSEELANMITMLRELGATSGWIYFNNTVGGAAIRNALVMQERVGNGIS